MANGTKVDLVDVFRIPVARMAPEERRDLWKTVLAAVLFSITVSGCAMGTVFLFFS